MCVHKSITNETCLVSHISLNKWSNGQKKHTIGSHIKEIKIVNYRLEHWIASREMQEMSKTP